MKDKYLTARYDHNPVFSTQIAPKVRELIDLCVQHKIPAVITFCTAIKDAPGGVTAEIISSSALPGVERTPVKFVMADQGFERGVNAAVSVALTFKAAMASDGGPCDCPSCVAERKRESDAARGGAPLH